LIYSQEALNLMADDLYDLLSGDDGIAPEYNVGNEDLIAVDTVYKRVREIPSESGKRLKYIDEFTFHILLGILSERNKVELRSAHGRGVGYFFLLRVIEESE